MRRWVLLEHTPPAEAAHLDLMLEADSDSEHRLVTFRLAHAAALEPGQVLEAQRLRNHRAVYLDFEGDVQPGRGRVCRLQRGGCEVLEDSPFRVEARIETLTGWRLIKGTGGAGLGWRLAIFELTNAMKTGETD